MHCRSIAEEALHRNTGARGLRAIIEDVMLEVMYEVPSRYDVTKVANHQGRDRKERKTPAGNGGCQTQGKLS